MVMKVDYTADSLLAPVYKGPFRIIHLDQGGARLKDIKTGEGQSVSFEYMRKIKLDELLTLLPQNFDAEINSVLDKYRYKRGAGENEGEHLSGENYDEENKEKDNRRKLRSGKLYNINVETLSENTAQEAESVYWREERVYKREQGNTSRSIIIAHSAAER
jgi:hypothetical protein